MFVYIGKATRISSLISNLALFFNFRPSSIWKRRHSIKKFLISSAAAWWYQFQPAALGRVYTTAEPHGVCLSVRVDCNFSMSDLRQPIGRTGNFIIKWDLIVSLMVFRARCNLLVIQKCDARRPIKSDGKLIFLVNFGWDSADERVEISFSQARCAAEQYTHRLLARGTSLKFFRLYFYLLSLWPKDKAQKFIRRAEIQIQVQKQKRETFPGVGGERKN